MTRPETPYEAASYDLNKFRERRMVERRATLRDTPDRRVNGSAQPPAPGNPVRNPSDPA
ncbi:hypothetical protein [Noviherbaspirillum cavernae]|uniref:hypothetical protein n=1 Tax=Noviherbaspirillum cavernae TaxID=2320862 RepID=UPI0013144F68|nr:hypothetical protein [Noviherbaspirillum cavernae]